MKNKKSVAYSDALPARFWLLGCNKKENSEATCQGINRKRGATGGRSRHSH